MCGIAGYYNIQSFDFQQQLTLMANALRHRGPDAKGFFTDGLCSMAHRRLSIIDLSDIANQPMYSQCGRYVMVYNGEVYNFLEIRKEILRQKDIVFKTNSDSEVVLEAFALWGYYCVKRFNGMFAIAVYDKQKRQLFLMRDRIGIKPLFIFQNGTQLAFASEIKALRAVTEIDQQLTKRLESVADFLHLGYIPEPNTYWNEISKFPSGCTACYDGKQLTIFPYWSAEKLIKENVVKDEAVAYEKLKELLISSVKMRLVSDVPFGTFLSGGIDSSLVTAIAQNVHSATINTFSIGFAESKFDESNYARDVAKELGTKHHEFRITEKEAMVLIPDLTHIYDEPFADSSAIPTLLVSKMAKQHVTMTLSGDGGDELFMGYGAYRWAERLNTTFWKLHRKPVASVLKLGSNRHKRIADMLAHEKQNIHSHIFSQEQYLFTAKEIRKTLLQSGEYSGYPFILPETSRKLMIAEQQAFFDLTHYLKDDLLVKVDRASMQHSLETRVPLLDYRIVEFAINLSPELKLRNGTTKFLLKKILYQYLPESLFNRPKWGFSVPMGKWMKGPLKEWTMDMLSEERLKKHGLVKPEVVNSLIKKYLKTDSEYLYNRLWALIVLHQI